MKLKYVNIKYKIISKEVHNEHNEKKRDDSYVISWGTGK